MQRLTDANRVLVTGGSGFIGTNLIDALLQTGATVSNLDCAPPQNSLHRRLWLQLDLRDRAGVDAAVAGFQPTYVVHLAARTDLRGRGVSDYDVNIAGLRHLIDALPRCSSVERVVYSSSMLVCRPGYQSSSDEDYSPSTAYGESKALGERLVRRISGEGPAWIIVRPTSIWGPWFGAPYRQFFEAVIRGHFVNFSGVDARKTFGYVGNVVFQILALLNAPAQLVQGRTFYLGDRPALLIRDWAQVIAAECNVHSPATIPMWLAHIAAKLGDLLARVGVEFPITTFRLQNMMTNNEIDLRGIYDLAGAPPFTVQHGVHETLEWLGKVPSLGRSKVGNSESAALERRR